MSEKKKYLKGFSGFKLFPITKNTETEYSVGTGVPIPYAQSLSKDLESSENPIYADDDIYDTGIDVTGETFTLTLAQLPDELRSKLEGGTYNETTGEYDFAITDESPEFACTYKGLLSNGNYKMYRQYRAKVTKIKVDLNTKGSGNNQVVSVEGKFMARACDKKLVTTKESTQASDLTWLNNIPTVTATPASGE